jgi:hypothetical protein
LSLGLKEIGSGFGFNDCDFVVYQQNKVNSHFFTRDRELEQDAPICSVLVPLCAVSKGLSQRTNIFFPRKCLIGVLAREAASRVLAREAREDFSVGHGKKPGDTRAKKGRQTIWASLSEMKKL